VTFLSGLFSKGTVTFWTFWTFTTVRHCELNYGYNLY